MAYVYIHFVLKYTFCEQPSGFEVIFGANHTRHKNTDIGLHCFKPFSSGELKMDFSVEKLTSVVYAHFTSLVFFVIGGKLNVN